VAALRGTVWQLSVERCGNRPAIIKRYVAWFNRYVAANYRSSSEGNEYYFDGSDCYQLRCVFLHEGSNAPHREKEKTVYHIAQFRIFENSPEVATDHIGRQWSSDDPNAIFAQVDLKQLNGHLGAPTSLLAYSVALILYR
jgi:hypothetical protein